MGREGRRGIPMRRGTKGWGHQTATFSGTFSFAVLPFSRFSFSLLHQRGSVLHTSLIKPLSLQSGH